MSEAFLIDLIKNRLTTRAWPVDAQIVAVQVKPPCGIVVGHAEIHQRAVECSVGIGVPRILFAALPLRLQILCASSGKGRVFDLLRRGSYDTLAEP